MIDKHTLKKGQTIYPVNCNTDEVTPLVIRSVSSEGIGFEGEHFDRNFTYLYNKDFVYIKSEAIKIVRARLLAKLEEAEIVCLTSKSQVNTLKSQLEALDYT